MLVIYFSAEAKMKDSRNVAFAKRVVALIREDEKVRQHSFGRLLRDSPAVSAMPCSDSRGPSLHLRQVPGAENFQGYEWVQDSLASPSG